MLIELLNNLLVRPLSTFHYLQRHQHPWLASVVLVTASWTLLLGASPSSAEGNLLSVLGFSAVSSVVLIFLFSLAIHWGALILGGTVSVSKTYQVVAISSLPLLFNAPLILLKQLTPSLVLTQASTLVAPLLSAWSLILVIIGVRETHGISTTRALVAITAPALTLLGLGLVTTLFISLLLV